MGCDICDKESCCPSFHSLEEQERFEKVIEAFDRAREMRTELNQELDEEAKADDILCDEIFYNPPLNRTLNSAGQFNRYPKGETNASINKVGT